MARGKLCGGTRCLHDLGEVEEAEQHEHEADHRAAEGGVAQDGGAHHLVGHQRERDEQRAEDEDEVAHVLARAREHAPEHVRVGVELHVLEHLEEERQHADRVEVERQRVPGGGVEGRGVEGEVWKRGARGGGVCRRAAGCGASGGGEGRRAHWMAMAVQSEKSGSKIMGTGYRLPKSERRVATAMKKMINTVISTTFQMSCAARTAVVCACVCVCVRVCVRARARACVSVFV